MRQINFSLAMTEYDIDGLFFGMDAFLNSSMGFWLGREIVPVIQSFLYQ